MDFFFFFKLKRDLKMSCLAAVWKAAWGHVLLSQGVPAGGKCWEHTKKLTKYCGEKTSI